MNESKTPETDEVEKTITVCRRDSIETLDNIEKLLVHALKLERERDEANTNYLHELDQKSRTISLLIDKNDQLRKIAAELAKQLLPFTLKRYSVAGVSGLPMYSEANKALTTYNSFLEENIK